MLPKIAAGFIRIYQLALSPYLGKWCRFEPSCSEYTRQAILTHGVIRGGWMGLRRMASCHPFHRGGFDPVPGLPTSDSCCKREP